MPENNASPHFLRNSSIHPCPTCPQDDQGAIRSQFFVCLMPMTPDLSKEVAACGHVLSGMEVLDAISAMPADSKGRLQRPVVISNAGEFAASKV